MGADTDQNSIIFTGILYPSVSVSSAEKDGDFYSSSLRFFKTSCLRVRHLESFIRKSGIRRTEFIHESHEWDRFYKS